jgi:hypothetical protein
MDERQTQSLKSIAHRKMPDSLSERENCITVINEEVDLLVNKLLTVPPSSDKPFVGPS